MTNPMARWAVIAAGLLAATGLFFNSSRDGGQPPAPPAPAPSPSPVATPTAARPTPVLTPAAPTPLARPGGNVKSVDAVIVGVVGGYALADRTALEPDPVSPARDGAALRYATDPPDSATDIFHTIAIHDSPRAARTAVRARAVSLEPGFEIVERRPVQDANRERTGLFIALRAGGQRYLLWSNRNVVFSLSGGPDAALERFRRQVPY